MKNYNVFDFNGIGYQKLFHYGAWRVAVLKYIDELKIENIQYVECHHDTDEVFVLLEGECRLYFYNEDEGFSYVDMIKHQTYVIPKMVYHTHVLDECAKLLIVENEDTCDENSTRIYLTNNMKEALLNLRK
jgi:cupin superfamily acireductone dioxygenase involved in methionine salvage